MNKGTPVYRLLAILVVFSMTSFGLPVLAADEAIFAGSVMQADSKAPIAQATVHVGDPATGEIYSSTVTGDDGSFSIEGVPAATYQVAIEQGDQLYVIDTPVELAPGVTRNATVMVGEGVSPSPATASAGAVASTGIWGSPVFAALIVIGGAFLLGIAIDEAIDDDDPATPTTSPT